MHALITIPFADLDRANAEALKFGEGTNFTLLAYGKTTVTDRSPRGAYCAAAFRPAVLDQVTTLITAQFPGATITPYDLDHNPSPLPAVLKQLGWRLPLDPFPR